jgi:hypothetical protein
VQSQSWKPLTTTGFFWWYWVLNSGPHAC